MLVNLLLFLSQALLVDLVFIPKFGLDGTTLFLSRDRGSLAMRLLGFGGTALIISTGRG